MRFLLFSACLILCHCSLLDRDNPCDPGGDKYIPCDSTPPAFQSSPSQFQVLDALSQLKLDFTESVSGADDSQNYNLYGLGANSMTIESIQKLSPSSYVIYFDGLVQAGEIILEIKDIIDKAGNEPSETKLVFTGLVEGLTQYSTPTSGSLLTSLPSQIQINFSKPVSGASNVSNYALSGAAAGSVSVNSVSVDAADQVRLHLSGPIADGDLIIRISNVQSLVGRPLVNDTISFSIDVTAPGVAATPADGSAISSLTKLPLVYTEDMIGAELVANYSLAGNGLGTLAISSIEVVDARRVNLIFSGALSTGGDLRVNFSTEIKDLSGRAVQTGNATLSDRWIRFPIDGATGPVVSFGIAPGLYQSVQAVSLSCVDAISGCSKVIFTTDGTQPTFDGAGEPLNGTEYTSPLNLGSGDNQVRAIGIDLLGNVGNEITGDFIIPSDRLILLATFSGIQRSAEGRRFYVEPFQPSIQYVSGKSDLVLGLNSAQTLFYKSTNRGFVFTSASSSARGYTGSVGGLQVVSNSEVLMLTADGLWLSQDAGSNFVAYTSLPSDLTAFYHDDNSGRLVAASSTNIYVCLSSCLDENAVFISQGAANGLVLTGGVKSVYIADNTVFVGANFFNYCVSDCFSSTASYNFKSPFSDNETPYLVTDISGNAGMILISSSSKGLSFTSDLGLTYSGRNGSNGLAWSLGEVEYHQNAVYTGISSYLYSCTSNCESSGSFSVNTAITTLNDLAVLDLSL